MVFRRRPIFVCFMLAAFSAQAAHKHPLKTPDNAQAAPEGTLNLLTSEGYGQPAWVIPFQQKTGCAVNRTYARNDAEMQADMAASPAGYDAVSASLKLAGTIIAAGNAREIADSSVPELKNFFPALVLPKAATGQGGHYAVPYQWWPLLLADSNTAAPITSLAPPDHARDVALPDDPAVLAVYAATLSKTLLADPFAASATDLAKAASLIAGGNRSKIHLYPMAADGIDLFAENAASYGLINPYIADRLNRTGTGVTVSLPEQGTIGYEDFWLIPARAAHPGCALAWIAYVTSAEVQAAQSLYAEQSPANEAACPIMEATEANACLTRFATRQVLGQLHFWHEAAAAAPACSGKTKKHAICASNAVSANATPADWDAAWRGLHN
jgi:putative spermidine/putrescine transport system substrate-binding protein